MHKGLARAGIAALGIALAAAAHAQWKWKDGSGRVQYSDLPPPPSVADKDILQRPAGGQVRTVAAPRAAAAASAAASGASPEAKAGESELDAKRRKAEEEKVAAEKAKAKAEEQRVAAAKAENCERARSMLRTLDDGARIARTNAKGEREFLDDAARAAERRRTMDIIASDCK